VYSTPSITTADNVQANISIGQDIPFVSSEEDTNGGNARRTVAFKNVSIALTVTPHVNESSELIALDVRQTINELIGTEEKLNAPIIANRQANTTVMVKDGQTIVIGGIIKDNRERDLEAVPYISKIPILGELFKYRTWKDQKSELMVFLRPHILMDEQSVDDVTMQQQHKLSDPSLSDMLSNNNNKDNKGGNNTESKDKTTQQTK
jgi:general secretion pathway protein D